MAMTKCNECGKEISSAAKNCPHCGKRRTSRATWLVMLLIASVVFAGYLSPDRPAPSTAAKKQETKQEPVKTDRQKQIDAQFIPFTNMHRALSLHVRKSMHDPRSYEHVNTVYWDRGDHLEILTTFRGKNAYGVLVKSQMRAKASIDGKTLEIIGRN